MAQEVWRQIAPLLAEDGIREGDTVPIRTLQHALDRAAEQYNLALFSPVRPARAAALTVLERVGTAIHTGDTASAAQLLEAVEPEPSRVADASVAGCAGTATGLLDTWLGGRDPAAPPGLKKCVRLPSGHWTGERAATDLLALAGKARAHASLRMVVARQGGMHVLYGSVLALAGTIGAWADLTGTAAADATRTALR
jgi:hypothetical protein